MVKEIMGRAIICEESPMTSDFGYKNTFLKLVEVRDSPTPNMIKARTRLIKMSIYEYCRGGMTNRNSILVSEQVDHCRSLNPILLSGFKVTLI